MIGPSLASPSWEFVPMRGRADGRAAGRAVGRDGLAALALLTSPFPCPFRQLLPLVNESVRRSLKSKSSYSSPSTCGLNLLVTILATNVRPVCSRSEELVEGKRVDLGGRRI